MHANLYGNLRIPHVDLLVIFFIFEVAKIDSKSDTNYSTIFDEYILIKDAVHYVPEWS